MKIIRNNDLTDIEEYKSSIDLTIGFNYDIKNYYYSIALSYDFISNIIYITHRNHFIFHNVELNNINFVDREHQFLLFCDFKFEDNINLKHEQKMLNFLYQKINEKLNHYNIVVNNFKGVLKEVKYHRVDKLNRILE